MAEILVGLLLGGSWLGTAAIGYRWGKDQGRHEQRMDNHRAALASVPHDADGGERP